jgi:cobalt-precorrin 5A hydrolase/precorrin-3B C17-methyltransferase
LTVGIGASRGVSGEEVLGLIKRVLHDAGLPVRAVAELATIDAKAGEPGLLCAADRLEVPLRTYPAGVLAGVDVPTPSQAPRAAVATPSVAEAAALVAAGAGGRLLVRKSTSVPSGGRTAPMATAAVAQISPDGRPEADRGGPGHHREHGGHDGCRHGQLDSKENQ